MHALHRDADQRYHQIRLLSLSATEQNLPTNEAYKNIRLRLIDSDALRAARLWDTSPDRRVDWDWASHYPSFKFRHPKRFELAIWDGVRLAGLSLGRPTYQGSALRLDVIEGSPFNEGDFKTFLINLRAMATYAEVLGARQLRIMNPINGEVRRYYETYGLTYVAKADYLYLDL